MIPWEKGTCPRCGKFVLLSQKDNRTLLAHSTPKKHREGCKVEASYRGTEKLPLSGFCADCGFVVSRDGRGCSGAGRVATEKRKVRK